MKRSFGLTPTALAVTAGIDASGASAKPVGGDFTPHTTRHAVASEGGTKMYRTRSLVLLAAQLATAAALFPTPAGAEPKNEPPFTRPADSRILEQAVNQGLSATVPTGEAKNELPFTRPSGSRILTQGFHPGLSAIIPTGEAKNEVPFRKGRSNVVTPGQTVQGLDTAIATAMAAQTAQRHSAQLGTRPQTAQGLDTAIKTAMAAQASEAANALAIRSTGLNQQYDLGTNATDAGAAQALHAVALRGEALNRQYQLGRYTPSARRSSAFTWADAGIGVGAMLGLALLATAFGLSVHRSHSEGRISATVG